VEGTEDMELDIIRKVFASDASTLSTSMLMTFSCTYVQVSHLFARFTEIITYLNKYREIFNIRNFKRTQ